MALLTNQDIIALMKAGHLIHKGREDHVSPCSYDLRIGTIFRNGQVINEKHPQAKEQIIIAPGEVVTMLTMEELSMPADIAATAYAMNGQSSEGLLVLNPGHVDPGFVGPLSVKAVNLRKVPLALSLGEKIFTVVFDKLRTSADPKYSHNVSRYDRELRINKKDVEKSMQSFSDLIAINAPFPTEKAVNELIKHHWLSWLSFFLGILTMITAVVAALFSVFAVYQNFSNESAKQARISIENKSETGMSEVKDRDNADKSRTASPKAPDELDHRKLGTTSNNRKKSTN